MKEEEEEKKKNSLERNGRGRDIFLRPISLVTRVSSLTVLLKQRENAKTRSVNRDGDITRQGSTVIMKKSGGNAITRVINDKRRFSSPLLILRERLQGYAGQPGRGLHVFN